MEKYIVEENEIRLDKYIAERTLLSRATIQRKIEDGTILVNGEKQKNSYKVNKQDEITIIKEEVKETEILAQDIPLDVIYEDNDILVINKQKGIVVHPGNGNPDGTIVNAILSRCKDSLSGIGGEIRPGIVHRIDKDTSGIIIIAKNDNAHINISRQIQDRKVKKTYLALVRGNIKENEATINMPIGRSSKDRTKMAVSKKGKEAITHFKVLKRYKEYTYLEIKIETGRTHQIRVHMSEIGFPVVGDFVYSNGKNPFGIIGQALHAYKLEFMHPSKNIKMELKAEVPKYFKDTLSKLDNE